MEAYGFRVHRNGKKTHRFSCCDMRNGCYSPKKPESPTGKRVSREAKRRARSAGREIVQEQLDNAE
jgi:hypothetical protein